MTFLLPVLKPPWSKTELPVPSDWDMISTMSVINETNESQANLLCKACGLCCSGHLFAWTKLRSAELDSVESLGLQVFRGPNQRGFNQPCPLWKGVCTVYASPHYPRFCQTYKCKLLKELLNEVTSFPDALTVVEQAKELIHEVEALLPPSPNANFRERLAAYLETEDPHGDLVKKAEALLRMYEKVFGVKDVTDIGSKHEPTN